MQKRDITKGRSFLPRRSPRRPPPAASRPVGQSSIIVRVVQMCEAETTCRRCGGRRRRLEVLRSGRRFCRFCRSAGPTPGGGWRSSTAASCSTPTTLLRIPSCVWCLVKELPFDLLSFFPSFPFFLLPFLISTRLLPLPKASRVWMMRTSMPPQLCSVTPIPQWYLKTLQIVTASTREIPFSDKSFGTSETTGGLVMIVL